jgi:hypothetical protein
MVAAVLLERAARSERDVPRLAAWRAWLFVGWVIAVGVAYLTHLSGIF